MKTLIVGATATTAGLLTAACGGGQAVPEGLAADQAASLHDAVPAACANVTPAADPTSPLSDLSSWTDDLAPVKKAGGAQRFSDAAQAALCQDDVNAHADVEAQEAKLSQGGLSDTVKNQIEARVRADVFADAVVQGVSASNAMKATRAPATTLVQLGQKAAGQDGAALDQTWLRYNQKTGELEKLAGGIDDLVSDGTRATLDQGLSAEDAQTLGLDAAQVNGEAALVPSDETFKAQQQKLLGVVEDAKSSSGKIEDKLVGEATAMYGGKAPDAVMSSVRDSLEKGTDFNTVYKGLAKDFYADPTALKHAVSDYMNGDVGTLVAQLTPGTAPDAECSAIVQRMLQEGATPAQIEAAVAAHVKTTFAYYVLHTDAIPHKPLMKWGLSPRTSDFLRVAGVTPEMVWQTIGDAGASAGTHAQDGVIDGHPYSAAFDLHIEHLSPAQIRALTSKLADLGIFGWFRNPGHDGWPSSELYHAHFVDAHVHMKSALRNQEYQWVRGEDGLVDYGHYSFYQPTKQQIATVQKAFAKSNG